MTNEVMNAVKRHIPVWVASITLIGWGFTLESRVDAIEEEEQQLVTKIEQLQDDMTEVKENVAFMKGMMVESGE